MRVELAEHVADGARRLLVLGIGIQPQFAHGVDDASLHRFQAVADMRQGAVHDHVHGIVQIGLLGELGQRPAFDPFQAQIEDSLMRTSRRSVLAQHQGAVALGEFELFQGAHAE